VLPEDIEIPLDVLDQLWRDSDGLPRDWTAVRHLIEELADPSVIVNYRPDTETLGIHDGLRSYARHCRLSVLWRGSLVMLPVVAVG
jgi:hypothetical protein